VLKRRGVVRALWGKHDHNGSGRRGASGERELSRCSNKVKFGYKIEAECFLMKALVLLCPVTVTFESSKNILGVNDKIKWSGRSASCSLSSSLLWQARCQTMW